MSSRIWRQSAKKIDAGYDHVVLTGIGPEQETLIGIFGRKLRPGRDELDRGVAANRQGIRA